MKKIVLDPGHGGSDPGAVGYVVEKDIALDVAMAVKERLLQYRGVAVRMTRTTDIRLGPTTTEDLAARARIANRAGADVFLSIHCNAASPPGTGFESFRYPGSAAGEKLQAAIHRRIPGLGIRDRGAKAGNLQVLRQTNMPAVLAECLFVNRVEDARLLKDSGFLKRMGTALADGVADYLGVEPMGRNYKAGKDFVTVVEKARAKGLSTPGPGHDYTAPLTEERFWALVARILRW